MIEDVYGARRAAQVFEDTWGHLRPQTGRHVGHLIAARSEYDGGERTLISAAFPDIADSPWLYDLMYELVNDADMAEGAVYRFDGALIVRDGRPSFEGAWMRLTLPEPASGGTLPASGPTLVAENATPDCTAPSQRPRMTDGCGPQHTFTGSCELEDWGSRG